MTGRQNLPARARRSINNNPRLRGGVMVEQASVFDPSVPFSDKPNARYGSREFHSIMMGAAALGVSVFGYTSAVRKWKTASQKLEKGHREVPCGEWMCNICQRIDPETLIQAFEEKISFQVKKMQFHGLLRGKTVDIALDMHLIRHWNKKHGADLVRSKSKGQIGLYERYVTAQAVGPGGQLALGGLHMPALEDTADYVRRIITACRNSGVEIGTVMLDRGFFSADVIRVLEELGVGYLIPCTNTSKVIEAIGDFYLGTRNPVVAAIAIRSPFAKFRKTVASCHMKTRNMPIGSGGGDRITVAATTRIAVPYYQVKERLRGIRHDHNGAQEAEEEEEER